MKWCVVVYLIDDVPHKTVFETEEEARRYFEAISFVIGFGEYEELYYEDKIVQKVKGA